MPSHYGMTKKNGTKKSTPRKGLTKKQMKLPPALRKAILAKMKKGGK